MKMGCNGSRTTLHAVPGCLLVRPARRGQVSLEYMLVVGFMFLLLAPLLILYANTQKDTQDTFAESAVTRAGNTIRDVAERVYYAGEPAQETVTILIPKQVTNVRIDGKDQVYSVMGGPGSFDVRITGVAPLNGTIPHGEGKHVLVIRAENGSVWIIGS